MWVRAAAWADSTLQGGAERVRGGGRKGGTGVDGAGWARLCFFQSHFPVLKKRPILNRSFG